MYKTLLDILKSPRKESNISLTFGESWIVERFTCCVKKRLTNKFNHFLICYLAFTVLRLVEIKLFEDDIFASQLIEFMRTYNITHCNDGSYINGATNTSTLK